MPGAGSEPAGSTPAGWETTPAPAARALNTLVPAPKFDPLTRRYETTAEGGLVDEHPVIARARHLIGIRRRGLPSSPTIGIPLGRVRNARPDKRQREIEDAVAIALKPIVDDGDAEILSVTLSSPWDGTFITELRNLRAPSEKPVALKASLSED